MPEFGVVRRPFGRRAWHAAGHSNEATLHMQHVQTTLRAVRLCLAVIVTITVAVCVFIVTVCVCVYVCVVVSLKSVQFLCLFCTHRFALAIIAIAIACACLPVVHLLILLQFLFYSSCSTECGLLFSPSLPPLSLSPSALFFALFCPLSALHLCKFRLLKLKLII